MTKEDFIEILDKYDSDFNLETGETIQAIYFQDFGKLAGELVKLFAIHNVVGQSEQFCECDGVQDLIAGTGECRKCGKECTY